MTAGFKAKSTPSVSGLKLERRSRKVSALRYTRLWTGVEPGGMLHTSTDGKMAVTHWAAVFWKERELPDLCWCLREKRRRGLSRSVSAGWDVSAPRAAAPRRLRSDTPVCGRASLGSRPVTKKDTPKRVSLVPVTGLEPVRCRQRWILSPLRLPIPSHRQVSVH